MITKPKGTYDLFGKEAKDVLFLQNLIENLMNSYNYEMIRTPLFEASELFHRGVGETTDIVTKETYDFTDRGERNLTLRPEGTAGAARCFIENKMWADSLPKKFWYYGPMYRYERPQKGRFREHYQFGCEVYGSFDSLIDAEIISIPYILFSNLGLDVTVHINSLGDEASRNNYREALINYLKPHINELCEDCQERFAKNPLRILDCKVDSDSPILQNVLKTIDYLNDESKTYFNNILKYLDELNIKYVVDPKTVRGLDYYTHTVFEITCNLESLGKANVLCGGGRYNNLIKSLGGADTPAVGFGMGTERLLEVLNASDLGFKDESSIDAFVIPVSDNEKACAIGLCTSLRLMGLKTDLDTMNKTVKNSFKQAEKLNAKFAIVVGEDEVKNDFFTVKNMKTKESDEVNSKAIIDYLYGKLEELEDSYNEDDYDFDDCCCDDECHCHDGGECTCGDDCHCGETCNCDENCHCHERN